MDAWTLGQVQQVWQARVTDLLAALERVLYIREHLNGAAAAAAWDKWTRDIERLIPKTPHIHAADGDCDCYYAALRKASVVPERSEAP